MDEVSGVIEVSHANQDILKSSLFERARKAAVAAIDSVPFISPTAKTTLSEKISPTKFEMSAKSHPAIALQTTDYVHLKTQSHIGHYHSVSLKSSYDVEAEKHRYSLGSRYPEMDLEVQAEVSVIDPASIDARREMDIGSRAKKLIRKVTRFKSSDPKTDDWISSSKVRLLRKGLAMDTYFSVDAKRIVATQHEASISIVSSAKTDHSTLAIILGKNAEEITPDAKKKASVVSKLQIIFSNIDGVILSVRGESLTGSHHETGLGAIKNYLRVDLDPSRRLMYATESDLGQATIDAGSLGQLISILALSDKPFLEFPVDSGQKFTDGEPIPVYPHPETVAMHIISQAIKFPPDIETKIQNRIRGNSVAPT